MMFMPIAGVATRRDKTDVWTEGPSTEVPKWTGNQGLGAVGVVVDLISGSGSDARESVHRCKWRPSGLAIISRCGLEPWS